MHSKRSHDVDFQIFGEDVQFVETELDPGETVIAEAGAMVWMEQNITFETKMGDGSEPDRGSLGKLVGGAKRRIAGESLFMTHYTNDGGGLHEVAFAAFLATLSGSGRVWLQSLPFSKLADRILAAARRTSGGGGQSIGENIFGSILER